MANYKDCIHIGKDKGSVKVKCGSSKDSFTQVMECTIHKRCLPMFKPKNMINWKSKDESVTYHLCHTCCEYSKGVSQSENSEK